MLLHFSARLPCSYEVHWQRRRRCPGAAGFPARSGKRRYFTLHQADLRTCRILASHRVWRIALCLFSVAYGHRQRSCNCHYPGSLWVTGIARACAPGTNGRHVPLFPEPARCLLFPLALRWRETCSLRDGWEPALHWILFILCRQLFFAGSATQRQNIPSHPLGTSSDVDMPVCSADS